MLQKILQRNEYEGLEDEVLKWATEWDEADDAVYAGAKVPVLGPY